MTLNLLSVFNDNTHEYDNFIVNLITVKCRLVSGTPTAKRTFKIDMVT